MHGIRKLARERRPTPAGFLETCQPTLAQTPPSGPGWLHEVKHDGYRLIARVEQDGRRVRIWSRNRRDYTNHFTGVAQGMAAIGINCVLDGEAVLFHPDGHSAFDALRSREASAGPSMVAFDVLEVDGLDFRDQPIKRRRRMLAELLVVAPPTVMLSEQSRARAPQSSRIPARSGWRASCRSGSGRSTGPARLQTGSIRRIRIGSGAKAKYARLRSCTQTRTGPICLISKLPRQDRLTLRLGSAQ